MRSLSIGLLVLASCATAGDEGSDQSFAEAPLVGVDGSTDSADRNCHVVLRNLARNNINGFTYETSANGSSWVWSGVIQISDEAAAEGLTPSLIYKLGSSAWQHAAITPGADATHFVARLDRDLVGPGWSATAITNARIEVVPFIAMPEGGRLFDHNRNPGDFDNYVMSYSDFAISRDDAVCAPPAAPSHANLIFSADYSERREGVISAGGTLGIEYNVGRLPSCRNSRNGNPLWDITAHLRFEPSGQVTTASVRTGYAQVAVPATGVERVVVYFENTAIPGCQAFDSDYGNNYTFDLALPPDWIGNAQTRISRDTSDPCNYGVPSSQGFSFESWARQRAAITNLCFEVYEPGLTDRDVADLWQRLDASIRYRRVGSTGAWTSIPAQHIGRAGNNARYAWNLRSIDPYRWPECEPTSSVAVEYYVVVNGSELRPVPGGAFAGTFAGDACSM